MDNLTYFKAIQQAQGVQSREEQRRRYERDRLGRALTRSVDYHPETLLNGEPYPMIVIPDKNDPNYCRIESVDNSEKSFQIGDYVTVGDQTWIVTECEQVEFIQTFGAMRLCNLVFKWQDQSGVIYSYPGIFGTAYRIGRLDRSFNDAHGQFEGMVPYNEDTKKIPLNKRFILWKGYDDKGEEIPVTFKIMRVDHISEDYGANHIIVFELARDIYNQQDSLSTMIADYQDSVQPQPGSDYHSVIAGSKTVRAGGNKRVLRASYTIGDVQVDPLTVSTVWNMELSKGLENYADCITTGSDTPDTFYIRVSKDLPKSAVGETVHVTIRDANKVYPDADTYVEVI